MCIHLEVFRQFRQAVYQTLEASPDAAFEIIDALASSRDARSAVEISLSPSMAREFSSVYKGLERTRLDLAQLRPRLVTEAERVGDLLVNGRAIYALDHTPYPRPHAPTVRDCGYVHGADGIEVGHQYSLLGRVLHESGSWVGVVDCERIATDQTPTAVGAAQLERLKASATLPMIATADSEYVTEAILDQADEQLQLLIRFRGNRNLYDAPAPKAPDRHGPQPQHGNKLKLNRAETLRPPDRSVTVPEAAGGWVEIAVWAGVHVTTRPDLPLCAVRVTVYRADGKARYQRPLWLAWTGPADLDWTTFWRVYLRRFCLECVHQFTKNSLCWTRARLGHTAREERWSWLVMLAYWQLVLAAPLAQEVLRRWEKPTKVGGRPTPGRVQRDYLRLLKLVGSPTRSPKVRGIAPGRPLGARPTPRPRFPVIHKSKTAAKKAKKVA